jgi:hypothetical protein
MFGAAARPSAKLPNRAYKLVETAVSAYDLNLEGCAVGRLYREPKTWVAELLSDDSHGAPVPFSERRHRFPLLVNALKWLGNPPIIKLSNQVDPQMAFDIEKAIGLELSKSIRRPRSEKAAKATEVRNAQPVAEAEPPVAEAEQPVGIEHAVSSARPVNDRLPESVVWWRNRCGMRATTPVVERLDDTAAAQTHAVIQEGRNVLDIKRDAGETRSRRELEGQVRELERLLHQRTTQIEELTKALDAEQFRRKLAMSLLPRDVLAEIFCDDDR